MEAARAFGAILAKNGIGLVYGGGAVGIMGALARSVLDHGGEVTGIIPEFLMAREHALHGTQELIVTRDMHERKQKMFELADAFVALPGGVGTLEELVEQITWVQLGRHKKPILLANINGFWDPLCALLDHMKTLEFIRGDLDFDLLVADQGRRHPADAAKGGGGGAGSRQGNDRRSRRQTVAAISSRRMSPPRCGCRRDRG